MPYNRMDLHLHIPAGTALSGYVTSTWEVREDNWLNERIIPQGVVEIIFNLGGRVTAQLAGANEATITPACFIQGLFTQTLHVSYHGPQHFFGVRLQPGMVKALLGILPSEVKNSAVDLALIKPAFLDIWCRLKESPSFTARVQVISESFPVLTGSVCPRTQRLCELFRGDGLSQVQSVSALSREICYSTRQLNRKSQSLFGLSAEELITYNKFLRAVNLLHCKNDSLTSVGLKAGFFDQAHFCRVFKYYAGITPGEYQKEKSAVPFHVFSMSPPGL